MSGGKQKEQKSKVEGWGPATERLENTFLPGTDQWARDYLGGGGLYEGPLLADQRLLEYTGQERLLQDADKFGGRIDDVYGGLEGFMDYDPNSPINQARREAFSASAMDEFNRVARPAIEDRGTFAGQFGGPQQDIVMGTALGDVGRDIAGFEADMMNQDRARALQAMGMAPGLAGQGLIPGQIMEDIGGRRTARDQLELEAKKAETEQERNNRLRALMEYQQMVAPLTGTSTVSSVRSPGANPIQGLLGGGLAGASVGGPFGAILGGGLGALGSLF